tara:strand:- start:4105 stop:5223 length:1119 start_codon:yes stop_codon:yes gene_type:complete
MNLEALNKRYPDGIPEDLQKGVSLFQSLSKKKGILAVKLMANFGKDLEQSLKKNTDIYKGVIIQTSSFYALDDSDRIWFHNELSKGRSLYEGAFKKTAENIGEFNSSVGTYSTYTVDELGGQNLSKFTIVDTAASKLADTTVDHWITTRAKMKDVYNDYKTNKTEGKSLQQHSINIRNELGGSKPVINNEYVSLFKGANSYHFYNHAIRGNGESLILQSALMGYSKVSKIGDMASDSMAGFMDINKLSSQHRNRVYSDCSWSSNSLVNTYVMRLGTPVKGEAYRMVKGNFSPNDISGLLDAATTLRLTPTRKNIPSGVACDEYTKRDIIPFALEEKTVQKVMKNHWRKLISSKYIKGDKFLLPRDIVEKSLV